MRPSACSGGWDGEDSRQAPFAADVTCDIVTESGVGLWKENGIREENHQTLKGDAACVNAGVCVGGGLVAWASIGLSGGTSGLPVLLQCPPSTVRLFVICYLSFTPPLGATGRRRDAEKSCLNHTLQDWCVLKMLCYLSHHRDKILANTNTAENTPSHHTKLPLKRPGTSKTKEHRGWRSPHTPRPLPSPVTPRQTDSPADRRQGKNTAQK